MDTFYLFFFLHQMRETRTTKLHQLTWVSQLEQDFLHRLHPMFLLFGVFQDELTIRYHYILN